MDLSVTEFFLQTLSKHWCLPSKPQRWHPCWSQKKCSRTTLPRNKMCLKQMMCRVGNLNYVDLQLDFGPTGPAFSIKPAAERRCLEKIETGRKIRLVEVWPGQGSGAGPAIDTAPDQKSQAPTFKNLINWKSSEIQRWPGAGHEPCPLAEGVSAPVL